MGYLMSENNPNPDPNPNSNDNPHTDTEGSRSPSPAPSTESERLNKSLNEIEEKLELLDKKYRDLRESRDREIALHHKFRLCSKILSYMPVNGVALSQVFAEASSNHKEEALVINAKMKADEAKPEFKELLAKRLEVLERLNENENENEN